MKSNRLNRRNFLRNTSLGVLGAGLLGNKGLANPIQDQENELPKIKEYRTLGRTGFKVSDISSGMISMLYEVKDHRHHIVEVEKVKNDLILQLIIYDDDNYITSHKAVGKMTLLELDKLVDMQIISQEKK